MRKERAIKGRNNGDRIREGRYDTGKERWKYNKTRKMRSRDRVTRKELHKAGTSEGKSDGGIERERKERHK